MIYSVKFNDNGKVYYFRAPSDLKIYKNVNVIVDTEKGLQYGKVVDIFSEDKLKDFKGELKEIVRLTTKDDYLNHLKNLKDAEVAIKKAQNFADELGLSMKFLSGYFTFDKKQLLLNFVAEDRVDFRQLTRKLAAIYRTRIELRQIGARDKASMIGGIGLCGRPLCCITFLSNLESVSMNMAKNQNLALNPSKINGECGRLLCCLAYEDEAYSCARKNMPTVGSNYSDGNINGKVVSVEVLSKKIKVDTGNEIIEVELNNDSNK